MTVLNDLLKKNESILFELKKKPKLSLDQIKKLQKIYPDKNLSDYEEHYIITNERIIGKGFQYYHEYMNYDYKRIPNELIQYNKDIGIVELNSILRIIIERRINMIKVYLPTRGSDDYWPGVGLIDLTKEEIAQIIQVFKNTIKIKLKHDSFGQALYVREEEKPINYGDLMEADESILWEEKSKIFFSEIVIDYLKVLLVLFLINLYSFSYLPVLTLILFTIECIFLIFLPYLNYLRKRKELKRHYIVTNTHIIEQSTDIRINYSFKLSNNLIIFHKNTGIINLKEIKKIELNGRRKKKDIYFYFNDKEARINLIIFKKIIKYYSLIEIMENMNFKLKENESTINKLFYYKH